MMPPHAETIKCIENLLLARLECLKHYPVLSTEAMHSLESGDVEGFGKKLDERAQLTAKVDEISAQIDNLVSQLDESCGAYVVRLIKPGISGIQPQGTPQWCTAVAHSMERTFKLLHNCALFDARLTSCAKDAQAEIQKQLNHVRAQRKINASYSGQNTASQSARNRFTSKF